MFSGAVFNLQVSGHGARTQEILNKGIVTHGKFTHSYILDSQENGKLSLFHLNTNSRSRRSSPVSPFCFGGQSLLTEIVVFFMINTAHLTQQRW